MTKHSFSMIPVSFSVSQSPTSNYHNSTINSTFAIGVYRRKILSSLLHQRRREVPKVTHHFLSKSKLTSCTLPNTFLQMLVFQQLKPRHFWYFSSKLHQPFYQTGTILSLFKPKIPIHHIPSPNDFQRRGHRFLCLAIYPPPPRKSIPAKRHCQTNPEIP